MKGNDMIAQYWEDVAALVRPAPLEDDGVLVWLAMVRTAKWRA
jgi:hypothetical protein